ncbi:UDP-N-acetylglucosamine transferase subunit ALG13 homolog [Athalia rosae]|uniref:UDP-N-acetylglucosamine transferase subunit ALG13 homolog n=1 Tax=Athalia rosae TaxID=37344 RepID=UPI00203497C3|nr:UDP-N-acetylglucosamine transferase subunit ALG13 homolog [Athalia rosae]
MATKKVFVTVGTTKFDELINTVTTPEVLKALSNRGYNHLILQIGNSSLKPDSSPRDGFQQIEYFNLSPSIGEQMSSADLVISHAGAGSCLEALEARKPLVVVTNELLMDNHQLELAEQLFHDGYLYYCNCSTLSNLIEDMDLTKLKLFTGDRSHKIVEFIDRVMGF